MAILNNNPLVGASGNQGGYNINNSLRFRSSASAYLNRTPSVAGDRQKFTYSGWVKRGALGTVQTLLSVGVTTASNPRVDWQFNASNSLEIDMNSSGTSWDCLLTTTQVFRDPSAWYHIVVAVDTTQATSSNRVKLYVNGNQVTSFSSSTYPAQNANMPVNNTLPHGLGTYIVSPSQYVDGYMADINFIDGSAKTPSDFGETDTTTGVWKPKAYTGTYGTNGFYLKFSDIATTSGSNAGLGKDFSGNSNYWTTNNISVTSGTTYDAMTDSPTNTSATVANYAVLNPLKVVGGNTAASAGNLNATSSASAWGTRFTTIGMSSGKWYWEVVRTGNSSGASAGMATEQLTAGDLTGTGAVGWAETGNFCNEAGSYSGTSKTWTTGDILQFRYDADAGQLDINVNNGTWFTLVTGKSGRTWFPILKCYGGSDAISINFGQRPFSYTPPTGYVALNTFNLPTPTILQGNKYMDATLYTGTGSAQTITNAGGFKPDLVWVKSRSNAYNNVLNDSVRGSTKLLISNGTDAEQTETQSITSFNSNGFSLGTAGTWNQNASTFVGWQWQAGQGSTSSNTSGSITSTVSVNTTAGFSVVTYTGTGVAATIGHGLGVAPKFYIVKRRNGGTDYWCCYHTSIGATKGIYLNTQDAAGTSDLWNDTAPTSTVFSVKTTGGVNASGGTYVAYCWAEIAGFSKFGSYTGVSGADSAFVYTGFRPKFVMIKSSNLAGENWAVFDTSRNTYNVTYLELFPNAANAEVDGAARGAVLDLLSNGFKIRATNPELNDPAGSYIYMAFAENPTKYALAR